MSSHKSADTEELGTPMFGKDWENEWLHVNARATLVNYKNYLIGTL